MDREKLQEYMLFIALGIINIIFGVVWTLENDGLGIPVY
mgnify:CR=1 FL=1